MDFACFPRLNGVASYRIEAKDYEPELVGELTGAYRKALDNLSAGKDFLNQEDFATMQESGPRQLGIGVYRFRQSQNSL